MVKSLPGVTTIWKVRSLRAVCKVENGTKIDDRSLPIVGSGASLAFVEERIKRIVADVSGHAMTGLVSNRDLRDYGIDSSRALEVLAECEDAFGMEIAEEAIPRLRTIADIASYVHGRAGL